MPPRSIYRPLAFASAIALTATAVVAGATAAQASHPGDPGAPSTLTASNGGDSIQFRGGSALQFVKWEEDKHTYNVRDAAWAPDGSRAIFATDAGDIVTMRYNDGANYWWVSPYHAHTSPPSAVRRDPVYRSQGLGVLWAAKEPGQFWRIEAQVASGGYSPTEISPGDGRHYLAPDSGPGALTVYQTQGGSADTPSGQADVGVFDGLTWQTILEDASSPSISPNGKKVAFVRGGQVHVADIDGSDVVAVTSNAATHDDPTWSPDGSTIAFTQGSGVATAPADGSGAANPTTVPGLSGVPAYQPRMADRVARLAGANRFGTATAVARAHWATAADENDARQFAESVVLSRSDLFADALGGAALAAAKQGPLLMTLPTTLNVDTEAELKRVLPAGKTVYLLGSTGAISTAVENRIKALGYLTERLAGANRYSTSVAIADEINPNPDLVLAATGVNFPDALAAGAAAGSFNLPGYGVSAVVVLTADNRLSADTKSYLDRVESGAEIYGIGGQGYAATEAYGSGPVVGVNRYETALLVAYKFFGGTNYAGVATGLNWPDALSGGALMATLNGPLLLTRGDSSALSLDPEFFLDEHSGSVHTGIIFGASGVVSNGQQGPIGTWLSGPGGFTTGQNPTDIGLAGLERGVQNQTARGARIAEEPKAPGNELREPLSRR
ncbi:cell wall-binding repeat-containing protein [Plantactinospora sp. WMMB334]|uniref:cell wall-binding repeat-containing protein n=1 Tax=Plantactinospora sp. WMMB334 TaxID=3404119 RepID=UPI003B929079